MEAKNTFVEIELETGEVVRATLTFYYLLQLKNKHKKVYERYNKIITNGAADEFDNITVMYTGYLCAFLADNGDIEDAMSEEEFISALSPDREYLTECVTMLLAPKKAKASAARS